MKQFLKTVLAVFTGLVLFAAFGLLVLSSLLSEPPPEVPDGAVLVIDLSTPITDKPCAESALDIVENTAASLALHNDDAARIRIVGKRILDVGDGDALIPLVGEVDDREAVRLAQLHHAIAELAVAGDDHLVARAEAVQEGHASWHVTDEFGGTTFKWLPNEAVEEK